MSTDKKLLVEDSLSEEEGLDNQPPPYTDEPKSKVLIQFITQSICSCMYP